MNIFKSFTMKWWQGTLFKWSMVSLGIVVGAAWPVIFNFWRTELLLLFILPTIYVTWIW